MDNSSVFLRTDLGNHELQTRTPGFPIKQRQLLFLIDGQKCIADLAAFSPDTEELKLRLVKLQELGLISLYGDTAYSQPPAPSQAETEAAPEAVSRNGSPSGLPSAKALQNVRRIIEMTDQTYLGNKLEYMLADVFDVMKTTDDLQFCIDRWHKSLREAGLGQMADAYMWQVRSALSD